MYSFLEFVCIATLRLCIAHTSLRHSDSSTYKPHSIAIPLPSFTFAPPPSRSLPGSGRHMAPPHPRRQSRTSPPPADIRSQTPSPSQPQQTPSPNNDRDTSQRPQTPQPGAKRAKRTRCPSLLATSVRHPRHLLQRIHRHGGASHENESGRGSALELGKRWYLALGFALTRDALSAVLAAALEFIAGSRENALALEIISSTTPMIGDNNSTTTLPNVAAAPAAPPASGPSDVRILDIEEFDASTIPSLDIIPTFLDPPDAYTQAVALIKNKERPANTLEDEVQFYHDYISNALRHIRYSGRKLNCLWWNPELKEGWYDSSLWCHIIDALCARSIYVTVLRKEIQIIPRGSTDRFDGVFRWMNGMNERFDLGVIEVGLMSQLPNSDSKPAIDRAKIIRGMAILLAEARKHRKDPKLQVIGILCSGWSITLFRMWHNGVRCVVEDRKFTIWTMDEHQARNLEVFKAVVQSLEILMQSATILMQQQTREWNITTSGDE
ncbi:hypothetical protein DFH27DRAFT_522521 [Peziza echinospora]|nr:hypothetical protein DFH27DRAFT_522521 [Peziza echinospora]